ncbi:MAG: IPT/TIG domain-containing protein [Deltaproteobacteria bacterium]|nr:IPT/TIG domain-containing protein [Deltaproteobacteria bacterium]
MLDRRSAAPRHVATGLLALLLAILPACSSPDDVGNGSDASGGGGDSGGGTLSGLQIVAIDPPRGPLAGGDEIDIEGVGIGPATKVYFGGVEAEVSWRAGTTHIFAIAPPAQVPGAVEVSLVDVDGIARKPAGYAYLGEVRIEDVEPQLGPSLGGTPIQVRGAGFHPGDRLLIGWRAAIESEVVDGSTLVARTPAFELPAGKDEIEVPVAIRHASGVTTWAGTFRYGRPPRLDRIDPATLEGKGGDITLVGAGLGPLTTLWVDGRLGSLVPGTASSLRAASAPANTGAAGRAVAVMARSPYGDAVLDPGLVYGGGDKPALFGVAPKTGSTTGGETVGLLADLAGAEVGQVRFAGAAAKVVVGKGSALVETPALAAGTHDVQATIGTSKLELPAAYQAFAPLQLLSVVPAEGPVAGGTLVTLGGAGLDAGCQVRIGAYAATVVAAKGATMQVRTPPGAPGAATVQVRCGPFENALADAFDYIPAGGPRLDAAIPAQGATGGGSLVTLRGAGLDAGCSVAFDGAPAELVEVVGRSKMRVRTPAHAPGPVTVQLVCPGGADALVDGYLYFSPTSPQGGTHGGPTFGTLNVTVLDIYTLKPLSEATVVVGQPSDAIFGKYLGKTDNQGQIVFAGEDLLPPLTVSASKTEYSASSIVHFGVSNATLLLFPWVPPSSGGGGGGPGLPLATLQGRILDLDKYSLTPPTNCLKPPTGGPICDFCEADTDCVTKPGSTAAGQLWACVTTGPGGKRCFNQCQSDADCDTDYSCAVDALVPERKVCRPSIGIRQITCATSTRSRTSENPPAGPGAKVDEKTGLFSISARLDELAIYCIAGYLQSDNSFVPTSMGVRRHVFPEPGATITGLDMRLDIPLQRTLPVRLAGPQRFFPASNGGDLEVLAWFALGSDGWIPIATARSEKGEPGTTGVVDTLAVPYQPLTLPESMTGTTQTWRARVDFGGSVTPIETGTHHESIVRPGDGNALVRGKDGIWQAEPVGVALSLAGVLRGPADELLLVARNGRLLRGTLEGASLIYAAPEVDAYADPPAVLAAAGTPTDATLVGQAGLIRRLDGYEVKSEKGALVEDLVGVCHGPGFRVTVGAEGGVAVDRGEGWSAVQVLGASKAPLRGVACGQSDALAVSEAGAVIRIAAAQATPSANGSGIAGAAALTAAMAQSDGSYLVAGSTTDGVGGLWRVPPTGAPTSVLPAGSKSPPIFEILVPGAPGSVYGTTAQGAVFRIDNFGLHDESPERLDLLPRAGVRLDDGRMLLVGEPGLWLGPFLSVAAIGKPLESSNPKPVTIEWTSAPSAAPSIHRVHVDGGGFPFWWLYVAPTTTSVELPDFATLAGIDVFVDVPLLARVDRIWSKTLQIDAFSTFDVEFGTWRSWSTNGKAFSLP